MLIEEVKEKQQTRATPSDRFDLAHLLRTSSVVNKVAFIQSKCRGKAVLDLGCIRHDAEFAIKDPNWLHKRIREVAGQVVGVDYLREEVDRLRALGYEVVWGDVTRPLNIHRRFDIIVAGDLIEHLQNFEGFFENCCRLLQPGGELIITTPNPFFAGQFHYVSLKNNFIINPEHTCWIDPQALAQLASRFGFGISEVHYLKPSWNLPGLISESKTNPYDILTGRWTNRKLTWRILRNLLPPLFSVFYWPYFLLSGGFSPLVRHSDYVAVLVDSAAEGVG